MSLPFPKVVGQLWANLPEEMHCKLLGTMLQSETVVAMDMGSQSGFLVPSLLPRLPVQPQQLQMGVGGCEAASIIVPVYIACYTGAPLLTYNYYETSRLKQRCCLPAGLFEQLLAGFLKLSSASGLGGPQLRIRCCVSGLLCAPIAQILHPVHYQ